MPNSSMKVFNYYGEIHHAIQYRVYVSSM